MALAVVGVALGACGGGDDGESLTPAAYVQAFVSLDQTHEGRAAPLRERLDAEFGGLADSALVPEEFIDTFRELADEDSRFTGEIAALDPPGELKQLHDDFVSALQSDREAVRGVLDQVSEISTMEELNQLLAARDVQEAAERRIAACRAVQELTNAQGVSVDLGCER